MAASQTPNQFPDMLLLVRAFQLSKMIGVAAEFGLADKIQDEPRSIEALARDCGADSAALFRLLRALAAFGIFVVNDEGTVAHTQRSRLLRRDTTPNLHYAALYRMMGCNWAAWGNLEHTLRTGAPAFEALFGMANFEYLAAHAEEADRFHSFMQHSPDDRHNAVADAYDFSGAGTLVDVGGGNGALVAVLLQKWPILNAILFDRESAVSAARAVLGCLISRCAIDAGNFFVSAPAGHCVYVLSQILHDWSDEQCLRILQVCRDAMRPDSRLLVIERVLGPDADPIDYLSDMEMMVLFPGAKERTRQEYSKLLSAAGFNEPRLIRTRSAFCILETTPAPSV